MSRRSVVEERGLAGFRRDRWGAAMRWCWPGVVSALFTAGCDSAAAQPAPQPGAPPGARAIPTAGAAAAGSAAVDPSAKPDTAAMNPDGRPAYVPDLSQPAPPEERTEAPDKSAWLKAPIAPEVRVTDPGCKAKRLGEWYRVECNAAYVSLIGGAGEGVSFGVGRESYESSIVFPARRGDARVFLFMRRAKWGIESDTVVSEQWLEGDRAPLITVIGIY